MKWKMGIPKDIPKDIPFGNFLSVKSSTVWRSAIHAQ